MIYLLVATNADMVSMDQVFEFLVEILTVSNHIFLSFSILIQVHIVAAWGFNLQIKLKYSMVVLHWLVPSRSPSGSCAQETVKK